MNISQTSRLRGLEVFLAVAEAKSFTAAARALGVSTSAAAQTVRALEARLRVPLFVRTTRSVNLTEAGQKLAAQVGPALRDAYAALDSVSEGGGAVRGALRITVGHQMVPLVLEPVIAPLLRAHPGLSVEVSVEERFVDIVREGYDLGVRLREAIAPDLAAVRLTPPFRFVVVGAPSYFKARGRPRRPRDLLAHACIGYRRSSGELYRWEFERRGREETVVVSGPVVSNHVDVGLRAAREGLGLAYLSEFLSAPFIERGELEHVLEEWAPRVPGYFAYFPARAQQQPKIRAFLEVARAALHALPRA